ncbi:MAG TPA: class I SAM-dependent methyltransferase [Vicinamibacterales bacterium]|nr:class I SAM-dependent methyltransferase [Vicinamibacterales bacterium]
MTWPRAHVRFLTAVMAAAVFAVCGLTATQPPGVHPISGRQYARPMGLAGAPWLDRDEREREEAPSRALAIMQVTPGSTVADIGAGSGYFTERLARLVGPTGKVYATDIQQGMLDLVAKRLSSERIGNVVTVLSEPANPKLPPASIDMALMVDVYHELWEPQIVLRHIRDALKPSGRLVLIEYKGEDPTIPIIPSHKMTVAQAKQELEAEGFVLTTANSSLPRQHVLIFTKK